MIQNKLVKSILQNPKINPSGKKYTTFTEESTHGAAQDCNPTASPKQSPLAKSLMHDCMNKRGVLSRQAA